MHSTTHDVVKGNSIPGEKYNLQVEYMYIHMYVYEKVTWTNSM